MYSIVSIVKFAPTLAAALFRSHSPSRSALNARSQIILSVFLVVHFRRMLRGLDPLSARQGIGRGRGAEKEKERDKERAWRSGGGKAAGAPVRGIRGKAWGGADQARWVGVCVTLASNYARGTVLLGGKGDSNARHALPSWQATFRKARGRRLLASRADDPYT